MRAVPVRKMHVAPNPIAAGGRPLPSPQKATPKRPIAPAPKKTANANPPIAPAKPVTPAPATPSQAATAATTADGVAPLMGSGKVALRALVVATDADDFGIPTWRATLDRVGAAYDVIQAKTTPLTAASLIGADGTGRYNAILLTNSMLLTQDASGAFVSAFDADEWNTLWAYERDYGVRQAVLYTSNGAWPEDYCLRPKSEGTVGDTILPATLTAAGGTVFDRLKVGARIPLQQSWVYRNTIDTACGGTPLLVTDAGDVLGVRSLSPDGRERAALSFSSNQYLLQSDLLVFGLFRWASKGLFLGDQRHYLKVDVDDWFNSSDIMNADLTMSPTPYEVTGHDAYNAWVQVQALRAAHPAASAFTFSIAYNGEGIKLISSSTCSPNGGTTALTATSKCLRNRFEWLNHTYSHLKLNFSTLSETTNEILRNQVVGAAIGLPVQSGVVKTGEYSGLGVYNDDPNDDISPPTDHGLMASNPNLLKAASALGVKYLHGNMSFPSHVPACFNCNIPHPMAPNVAVVPDWPTNIAYFSSTPEQETAFYNSFYGPKGRFPYWPVNQTYAQIINHESDQGLSHLATGSMYTHTMHIPNLKDYGNGRTLATDWAQAVVGKFSSYYTVPLLSPSWRAMADLTTTWRTHFATKDAVTAVFDPATNLVTLRSSRAGKVIVSGGVTANASTYGTSVSSTISLAANQLLSVSSRRMS